VPLFLPSEESPQSPSDELAVFRNERNAAFSNFFNTNSEGTINPRTYR